VLAAGAFLGSFLLYSNVFLALMPTAAAAILFVLCDLVCCALLFFFVYLAGTYFAAVALAIGNESLNLLDCTALAFAASRGRMGCIFRFVMRGVWHFLLSVITLGVLWLLYYAHHTSVTYMHLARTLCKSVQD
jgi:TRAP-type C4-dicarboxylate transport system permease small subunit